MGYQVLLSYADMLGFTYVMTKSEIDLSTTIMFLSVALLIFSTRICVLSDLVDSNPKPAVL
jgi:hypothetical protein